MTYTERISSPVGDIWITVDEEYLICLTVDKPEKIENKTDPPGLFYKVKAQLEEYFSGERKDFELPVKFEKITPFQQNVLEAMCTIPYGCTVTYSELAKMAGNPKAIRAAASVCPKNPVFIIVPCHRVIKKDGSIGEYAFGSTMKRWLLNHESKYKEKY